VNDANSSIDIMQNTSTRKCDVFSSRDTTAFVMNRCSAASSDKCCYWSRTTFSVLPSFDALQKMRKIK